MSIIGSSVISFVGQLVAVCLELLAEFLEFTAASGIFVALSAGQTRLLREYRCRGCLSRQDDQHCGCHPSRRRHGRSPRNAEQRDVPTYLLPPIDLRAKATPCRPENHIRRGCLSTLVSTLCAIHQQVCWSGFSRVCRGDERPTRRYFNVRIHHQAKPKLSPAANVRKVFFLR
jgi:hypothetical protein